MSKAACLLLVVITEPLIVPLTYRYIIATHLVMVHHYMPQKVYK